MESSLSSLNLQEVSDKQTQPPLSLPLMCRRIHQHAYIQGATDSEFEHIIAKTKKLVNGGIPRMLSSAGREVLIISICEDFPTYSMIFVLLSKKCYKKLTWAIARF